MPAQAKRDVMDAVRAHFRPEFLNRLDDMIVFDRLTRDDMDGIVDDPARAAGKAAGAAQDRAGRWTTARASWLADEGYDPVFGARPLKRVIQRSLQDQLAEMILAGDVMDGSTVAGAAPGPTG